MKHFIKKEFETVSMPQACAHGIRQAMEEMRPAPGKKLRTLTRVLIAAAVTMCLLVSVAAIGIQKGWLDDFLGNSEKIEEVNELNLTAQDGELEVTLDRILTDGPFVYLQVSARTRGNVNAVEAFENDPMMPENVIQKRLETLFTDGEISRPLSRRGQEMVGMKTLSSEGPTRTWYMTRIDDGSDIHYCSYTMQILMAELPADYEGLGITLNLYKQRAWTEAPGGGYTTDEEQVSLIEENIILTDAKARVTTMEDGRQVKIHALGVQIQGSDFAVCDGNGNWNSGVMLKDGTQLHFKPGYLAQDYFAEEMQWNLCLLNEVIDPEDVVGVFVGEKLYPINLS